jgi:hypothetical protein
VFFFNNDVFKLTESATQCAHKLLLSGMVILAAFNIDLVFPNKVAKARSTLPFCCGVPGAVNSNLMWNSGLNCISLRNAIFSPELSRRIVLIANLSYFFTRYNQSIIVDGR